MANLVRDPSDEIRIAGLHAMAEVMTPINRHGFTEFLLRCKLNHDINGNYHILWFLVLIMMLQIFVFVRLYIWVRLYCGACLGCILKIADALFSLLSLLCFRYVCGSLLIVVINCVQSLTNSRTALVLYILNQYNRGRSDDIARSHFCPDSSHWCRWRHAYMF